MKKIITSLLVGNFFFAGCQNVQEDASDTPSQEETQSKKETIKVPDDYPEITDSFFNEEVIGYNEYPVTAIPPQLEGHNLKELRYAMDLYYSEHFSPEEKEINAQRIPQDAIDSLQKTLDRGLEIQKLEASVAQVKVLLDGETTYITRIVVPKTYEQAEELVPENDHVLLAEAVTEVGDRLVMIAYEYDGQIVPYHLFTTQHSLFTLKGE